MSKPFTPKTAWTPEWLAPNEEEEMRIRAADAYEPEDDEISDEIIERLRKRDHSQDSLK